MLARDPSGTSRFAAIQNAIPQALYKHYGFDAVTFDTFMVLSEGVPLTRWRGVLGAAGTLPWPWRWLTAAGRIVPNSIGDRLYDWVQSNRIAWFGRRESCLRSDPEHQRRFLT